MKHIYIKNHSESCQVSSHNYCATTFICYAANNFWLVTYNNCEYKHWNELDVIELIIKQLLDNQKVERLETHRCKKVIVQSKQELAEAFTEGFVNVHHYVYHNNFHGFMSVSSEIKYSESFLTDENEYMEKYLAAEQVLRENNKMHLQPHLNLLMQYNYPDWADQRIIVNTVNDIYKTIKQLTK